MMSAMSKPALLLALAAVGCGLASNEGNGEHTGMSRQPMVGGTVSTADQDSVVFLMKGQDESCSGTLIAPNLVLTARHCVAEPNESTDECVGYGATVSPSQMSIKVGVSAGWTVGSVAASGKQIITPSTVNMCGFDVALIVLTRDVAGAMISPVRFSALEANEATVTVGYGVDGNDRELTRRMQRTTTILGVGPAQVAYKMKDGNTFNYTAPDGDVVTGESTCFGDSGGPLFDMKGNVVAMTSRGPANAPEGAAHGNGCIDMVSIYAGAKKNEATIRAAATAAGHPLPANVEPPPPPAADATPSTDAEDDTGTSQRGTTSTSDDADSETTPTKKKKTSQTAAAVPAGCSAAPGRTTHGDAWLLAIGVAVVFAAKRRRVTA